MFPAPQNVMIWANKEAKKQGKSVLVFFDENKKKFKEYGGYLALEAAFAEAKGYPLEDYWKARLKGAGEIESESDIKDWLNR